MKAVAIAGAVLAATLGLAACGSSSSTPTTKSGTETLNASITGSAAVKNLESNSNAPLVFPVMTWTGVVSTSEHNESLGGGKSGGEHAFKTAAGDFAVIHKSLSPNGTGGVTGPVKGVCTFRQVMAGTYTVVTDKSTGSFKGATGHGTYAVTITGVGPAAGGVCKMTSNGPSVSGISSASIVFLAHGPLSVTS